jgi:hypothetical protein
MTNERRTKDQGPRTKEKIPTPKDQIPKTPKGLSVNNQKSSISNQQSTISNSQPPPWLWRIATWSFVMILVGVAGLAGALSLGLTDPTYIGSFKWQDDFKSETSRWEFIAPEGGSLNPHVGALLVEFSSVDRDQLALALTARPQADFTLEVAGAQPGGESEAAYGLVFAWQDATHYSAVLINGNGYAEAYRLEGGERRDWFQWQQWPNILLGTDNNRVRVDVRGTRLVAWVNDEFLVEATTTTPSEGKIGLLAKSAGPAQVVFSWARVWER